MSVGREGRILRPDRNLMHSGRRRGPRLPKAILQLVYHQARHKADDQKGGAADRRRGNQDA
jgi:hypothetical protein